MALRLVVLSSTGYVGVQAGHTCTITIPLMIRTAIFHAEADSGEYRMLLCTVPVKGSCRDALRFQHTMLMNHVRH